MSDIKMSYMTAFSVKTQDEMTAYLDGLTNPQEKALAYMIFALTWNMCAKMVNGE